MTEFAIVDDGVIVAFRQLDAAPSLAGKPYRRFLPVVTIDPPFDPVTQIRTGPVLTIGATEVTRGWAVRDKTPQEISAEAEAAKESALGRMEIIVLRVLFNQENRIRTLEGKQAVTIEQFKAALKATL